MNLIQLPNSANIGIQIHSIILFAKLCRQSNSLYYFQNKTNEYISQMNNQIKNYFVFDIRGIYAMCERFYEV